MKRFLSALLAFFAVAALTLTAGPGSFAEGETPAEPAPVSGPVVYMGFNGGSDANSGLSPSSRKQYYQTENGALSLLPEGGTVVTVTKGWFANDGDTLAAPEGRTILMTAKDTDGTSYIGDLGNTGAGEYGYVMPANGSAVNIEGDVIFRDVGLLDRTSRTAAAHPSFFCVRSGARAVFGEGVVIRGRTGAGYYSAPGLTVDAGGTAFLHVLGFSHYSGGGTIVLDRALVPSGGLDRSLFTDFTGTVVDETGEPFAFAPAPAPEEPVLANTGNYAYVSFIGNNTNDGRTAATLKQGWGTGKDAGVMALVMDGGTVVIPQKGFVSQDYTMPLPSSPVRFTAVDRDGTDYRGNINDSNDQCGSFMIANSHTVVFPGDYIFDDIILLDRTASTAEVQTTYTVAHGGRLVIGTGAQVCCMASALNPPILRVETGGIAFLHAVGFDRYEGSGTVVIDRSIIESGVLYSSEFSSFTGRLIDETGAEISPSDFADKPQEVKPDDVFLYGSYTASNGYTVPYRYYLPEGYDGTKRYPLFLNMHGNGSRGSDNHKQLTFGGSVLNTAVFQSGYECIMLAPQCPASSAWVPDSGYPGSKGFLKRGMSPYLAAAKELLDKFLSEYAVDPDRVYVSGSSNGGAASWELCYRFPELFAAAVPLAGVRPERDGEDYEDASAAIAGPLTRTPIWTFHGTADTTLPVAGTQNLVQAIRDAGGEQILYTEYPGATHGTIWALAAQTEGLVDWIFAQRRVSGSSLSLSLLSRTDGAHVVTAALYPADAEDAAILADPDGTLALLRAEIGEAAETDGGFSQRVSFEGIAPGSYRLLLKKAGKYAPRILSVTAGGEDCDLGEVALLLWGDANGDGTVNAKDALQISRYAAGKGSVFGSSSDGEWEAYRFAAADVNGDGLVNSRDALQISRYAAGKSSQFDQKD